MAIAFHPDHEYVAADVNGEVYILAKKLLPIVAGELGWAAPKPLATFPGRELEGFKARHPFIDRVSLFVRASTSPSTTGPALSIPLPDTATTTI
jgi:isoleucyl-tRNA synthetase